MAFASASRGDSTTNVDSPSGDEPARLSETLGACHFHQLAELMQEARFSQDDPFYLTQAQHLAQRMRAGTCAGSVAAGHIDDLLAAALISGVGVTTYAAAAEAIADGFKCVAVIAPTTSAVQSSRSPRSVDLLIVASDPMVNAALDAASTQLLLETRHATSFREAIQSARRFRRAPSPSR